MILIDIEMPDSCWSCPLQNPEYGDCNLLDYDRVPYDYSGRRINCPLKEVKNESLCNRADYY